MSTTQRVCGIECAKALAMRKRAIVEYRERREAKKRAKTRAQWAKEAQMAFNRFIRMRDAHLPCISCGRHHAGQYHAGHYRSTKAAPELRFDEVNTHKQCQPCNSHLSGNVVAYRAGLIGRVGVEAVERLEGHHEPRKWAIDELKAIKEQYQAKAKELQRSLDVI